MSASSKGKKEARVQALASSASAVQTHFYHGTSGRIVDGDTLFVEVDLGFRIFYRVSARLLGYSAPELSRPQGRAAAATLARLLPAGSEIIMFSDSLDDFGRSLAVIWKVGGDSRSINMMLLEGR